MSDAHKTISTLSHLSEPTTRPSAPTPDELRDLVVRAHAGDASTVPALQKLFELPGIVEVMGGDLARIAQNRLVDRHAGRDHLVREALFCKLRMLRTDLCGSNPSPLERLLVERIVSCWLQLHQLEYQFDARFGGRDNEPHKLIDSYQRSIQRAQRNYLSSIKALATVRKLALPALQVNIARKQVNMMNPAREKGDVS